MVIHGGEHMQRYEDSEPRGLGLVWVAAVTGIPQATHMINACSTFTGVDKQKQHTTYRGKNMTRGTPGISEKIATKATNIVCLKTKTQTCSLLILNNAHHALNFSLIEQLHVTSQGRTHDTFGQCWCTSWTRWYMGTRKLHAVSCWITTCNGLKMQVCLMSLLGTWHNIMW